MQRAYPIKVLKDLILRSAEIQSIVYIVWISSRSIQQSLYEMILHIGPKNWLTFFEMFAQSSLFRKTCIHFQECWFIGLLTSFASVSSTSSLVFLPLPNIYRYYLYPHLARILANCLPFRSCSCPKFVIELYQKIIRIQSLKLSIEEHDSHQQQSLRWT